MIRFAKRIAVVALPIALIATGTGWAKPHREIGSVDIRVQNVFVGQKGRLSVSGVLRSDLRTCRAFQGVYLMKAGPGQDEFMDVGIASALHGAWATRTKRGAVEDGAHFYMKTERQSISIMRIGAHGRHRHRRTIVCRGDRVPVPLPAPEPAP